MADHYDTAYMADRYEKEYGGSGARIAACGADDNHSATAAMMLAAPIFLELSKEGKLGCDIWLVHLTGEEFPADCLGARALTAAAGRRHAASCTLPDGKTKDLSGVQVQGLYVSDMIAHNNDRDRDVFQIAPGHRPRTRSGWRSRRTSPRNLERVGAGLERAPGAGRPAARAAAARTARPFRRSRRSSPSTARSAPVTDPRSTLYNTDGQIFSDAGVPVVLFMENYDINRAGYHDTHDTMANIDLDYGAAVCAITIESVARAASPRT